MLGGRRRSPDLHDLVLLLLATGMRIGEALALQWTDVDVTASVPTVRVAATLVEPRRDAGTGQVFVEALHRQPLTKTGATRVLALPTAAVEMLHRRRAAMPHPEDRSPVFAHAGGGWLWPNNQRTKLRALVTGTSLAGVTPHTLRRTVGTVVAQGAGLDAARDLLGHRDPSITARQLRRRHRRHNRRTPRPGADLPGTGLGAAPAGSAGHLRQARCWCWSSVAGLPGVVLVRFRVAMCTPPGGSSLWGGLWLGSGDSSWVTGARGWTFLLSPDATTLGWVELDAKQRAAVQLAGRVKASLVDFATSPPFERHVRRIARETLAADPGTKDVDVVVVEKLLFGFRYDDGTTVVDRFVGRPRLSQVEREMARGFLEGVEGFFEVLADTSAGARAFEVRCCLSDLEHVVAPTEPAGIPELPRGSFLAGRLNPVAGTDLWTPSGLMEVMPESSRGAIADAVMEMALQAPWLTHRNPEKLRRAAGHVAAFHERFVSRHGSDLVVVEGNDLAELYAEAIASGAEADAEAVASSRGLARRAIEESELAEADYVLVYSHPVAGLGFYRDFVGVTRALESGADADPADLDLLRGYLDDPGVPSWLLRRLITDRLPAAEAALARALARPDFDWLRDGEPLLASTPGDDEPTVTLAIVPTLARGW